jgi:hypothetical protein
MPKNEIFMFKSNDGKMFDIKFTDGFMNDDIEESFSKVEYVITYYKPKQKNSNIIIDTFIDACSRIVEHLSDLTKINGNLVMKDENNNLTPIGIKKTIINKRILYHKPDTNLYYMDIYDSNELNKPQSIRDAYFIPQMTFRSKAIDCIDIIKCIVESSEFYKYGEYTQEKETSEYKVIVFIEEIVDKLFENYNKTAKHKIPMDTDTFKILRCCIFLIYYKLFAFIYSHAEILIPRSNDKSYLKDVLSFSSRHNNLSLYMYIKSILKKKCNIKNIKEIHKFLIQPDLIKVFYERVYEENEDELYYFDYDKDDKYQFNENAYKDNLSRTDKNFGNPLYSFSSYFDYFEKNQEDWLYDASIDAYSTTFPIENNNVMVEYRMFRNSISSHFQNNFYNTSIEDSGITINQMQNIVTKYNEKNNGTTKIIENKHKKHLHFDKHVDKSEKYKKKHLHFDEHADKPKKDKKIEHTPKKRCPNGRRKNKLTGNCEETKKHNNYNKRCLNGTRRNKSTGNCDKNA